MAHPIEGLPCVIPYSFHLLVRRTCSIKRRIWKMFSKVMIRTHAPWTSTKCIIRCSVLHLWRGGRQSTRILRESWSAPFLVLRQSKLFVILWVGWCHSAVEAVLFGSSLAETRMQLRGGGAHSVGGRVEPRRRWQSAGEGRDASYGGGSLMTLDHSSAPILAFRMEWWKGFR